MSDGCKIHWVSGKGGVGKSTFAYALGQELAEAGKRCLLVEIGDKSFYSYALKQNISYEPSQVETNLFVSHWHWHICLREYVQHFIKIESLAKVFMENRVMKNIMAVAPGIAEISILGKLTSGIRNIGPKFEWDHIILDAHSTGHTESFLQAPKALHTAIGFGPLGRHSEGIDRVLMNEELITYYLVTLPEELPTQESLEFHDKMKKEFSLNFKVILNQLFPENYFANAESKKVQAYIDKKQAGQKQAEDALSDIGIYKNLGFKGRKGHFSEWVKNLRGVSDDLA